MQISQILHPTSILTAIQIKWQWQETGSWLWRFLSGAAPLTRLAVVRLSTDRWKGAGVKSNSAKWATQATQPRHLLARANNSKTAMQGNLNVGEARTTHMYYIRNMTSRAKKINREAQHVVPTTRQHWVFWRTRTATATRQNYDFQVKQRVQATRQTRVFRGKATQQIMICEANK
jgi:hypothetical protein